MAVDKLVDSSQLNSDLTSVANAIRAKSGGSSQLAFPAGFVSEIGNIQTGGGSSYTLLYSTELTANTTSTSNTSLSDITVSAAALWTGTKIIYVRIRDKAGARNGYFYGADVWFINYVIASGKATTNLSTSARFIWKYSNSEYNASSSGYGVYPYDINDSGKVRIYTRYNSSFSGTINGTYVVEVYSLDCPPNKLPLG